VQTINNLPSADTYTEALRMLSQRGGGRLVYVVANASVLMQLRPLYDRASAAAQFHGSELLVTPSSGIIDGVSGVQFKSAVLGSPARVIAQLYEPGDPLPSSGTPFTQTLQASGNVASLAGELDYQELAPGDVTISAAEGAPLTLCTFKAVTFDGVTPVEVEFFAPAADASAASAANELGLSLWSGTDAGGGADMGRLFHFLGSNSQGGIYGRRRFTPAAGSAQYRVRGWRVTNNYTLRNNAGGVGVYLPAFGRLYT
jgi:hypothetical protein